MTTKSHTFRRLAAGSLAGAAVAVLAATNPAVGASHSADDAACSFDPAFLPQTADAMQGWYDQCRSQQPFSTTKAGLPAGDHWYVQRKTGYVFVTDTGPPSSEATDTQSTNRPVYWRAMMNEIPEATDTQDFESLAARKVANGDWTPDAVNRIAKMILIKKVAALYQGIERREGPLGVHTR